MRSGGGADPVRPDHEDREHRERHAGQRRHLGLGRPSRRPRRRTRGALPARFEGDGTLVIASALVGEAAKLVGMGILDVDVDNVVADARNLVSVSDAIASVAQDTGVVMAQATEGYTGRSASALAGHWQQTGGAGDGALPQAADA